MYKQSLKGEYCIVHSNCKWCHRLHYSSSNIFDDTSFGMWSESIYCNMWFEVTLFDWLLPSFITLGHHFSILSTILMQLAIFNPSSGFCVLYFRIVQHMHSIVRCAWRKQREVQSISDNTTRGNFEIVYGHICKCIYSITLLLCCSKVCLCTVCVYNCRIVLHIWQF